MTRYTKNAHGHYLIHGHKYEILEGSRAQVLHGTAYKTSGGLKKGDIMMNKNGRIVSKSKHASAKKDNRLLKAGYGTKKGKFGFVKLGSMTTSKSKSRSKKSKKSRKSCKKYKGGSGDSGDSGYSGDSGDSGYCGDSGDSEASN